MWRTRTALMLGFLWGMVAGAQYVSFGDTFHVGLLGAVVLVWIVGDYLKGRRAHV